MFRFNSLLAFTLVVSESLLPTSTQDYVKDIYLAESRQEFGVPRSALYIRSSRTTDVIGSIGRAKYAEDIRSGPYGECDVIGHVSAGDKVVMRASALPGWTRVLLTGGGHGYVKSYSFEIGDYEVTGKRTFAPAPERQADDPYRINATSPVPPGSSRLSPTIPRANTSGIYLGPKSGHWISEVSSSGSIVELEDGSIWEISSLDRIDTSLWLVTDDIVVLDSANPRYPYKLLNKDQGETAEAKLLRG
jgi:hypothetical protein